MVEIKPRDCLLAADDLVVAVAPAQPEQIVAHRFGQEPLAPVLLQADRAVALGELLAVGAVNERDMGKLRHRPAEGLIELVLAKRIGEVIIAADDMRDRHVVVIDDTSQHVGRRAVSAQQHHVVELLVGDCDGALHQVIDPRFAGSRRLQANHWRHALRRFRRIAVAPAPVVAHRTALRARVAPHLLQFLRRGVAKVGFAGGKQLAGRIHVPRRTCELVDWLSIPVEAEPAQPVQDRIDRRLGRAGAIGILDPQQEATAVATGEQKIEQRRARGPDVQKAGRRGCKSNRNRHLVPLPFSPAEARRTLPDRCGRRRSRKPPYLTGSRQH